MTSIGNKIKKVRELRNYTQDYMANKLNMSPTGYGNIERDETDLPFSRLEKIAEALGMRIEDLISFDEKVIFNISNNSNPTTAYIIHQTISPEIKQLYETQIELLNDKIKFLEEKIMGLQKN
jgi:transcriptional regulator with XRE-family HTH domain